MNDYFKTSDQTAAFRKDKIIKAQVVPVFLSGNKELICVEFTLENAGQIVVEYKSEEEAKKVIESL